MAIDKTIGRAKAEIENKRYWRAKEILHGSLNTYGYDTELYEIYGVTLLKMGDLLEAGRFLFLSAKRKEEYNESIEIYKRRYFKNGPKQIYSTFPNKAKLGKLSKYPDIVRKELENYDFPEILEGRKSELHLDDRSIISRFVEFVTPVIFIILFIALVVLGLIKGWELIYR